MSPVVRVWLLLLLVAGCGAPAARDVAAPVSAPAEPTSGASEGPRTQSPEGAPPPPAHAVVPEGEAWHHFFAAREAYDALVRADASGVRAALERLGRAAAAQGAPEAWQPQLGELERLAEQGSRASDTRALAGAVTRAGAVCGDCHTQHAGRAVLAEGDTRGYRAAGRSGVSEEMARHQWPGQQLWLGLTAPRETDWARGVAGLGEGWESLGAALPPELDTARAGLGTARMGSERADALARLVVQCARCHGQ